MIIKSHFLHLILIAISTLLACNSTQAPQQNDLIGSWQNTLLDVKMKSFNGIEGKDSSVLVNKQNWEQKLQMKPIQTIYSTDSTWQSDYTCLEDKLISSVSGKWWIKGDTLWMHTLKPKDELNFYVFTVRENKVTFKTTVDWDSDGIADDVYYGEQERVKKIDD